MAQPTHGQPDTATSVRQQPDIFLNASEAAELLNLKLATVYSLTSERRVPHYKRGGKLYFRRSELIEWLTEGRRPVIDGTTANDHLTKQRGGK